MDNGSHSSAASLPVTADGVLSVAQAAARLPVPDADAVGWLVERGLVRTLAGREVVIWGDVLAGLRTGPAPEQLPARPLVPGQVVSEDRAARALPWRRADVVSWLRREGLSVPIDGRRVVIWSHVLDRLRSGVPPRASLSGSRFKRSRDAPALLGKPGRVLG